MAELTWNTFRDHLILEYEIPKYEGDLGRPNLYVPVGAGARRAQGRAAAQAASPARAAAPGSATTPSGRTLRLRGIECNAPGRYAEAFQARKLVL